MAKAKCINCGAECCSCWGCNPATYKDGLCPKCQSLKSENVTSSTSSMSELSNTEEPDTADRFKVIQA